MTKSGNSNMKNSVKGLVSKLVSTAVTGLALGVGAMQEARAQITEPLDLICSAKILDAQNRETRDLTPGQNYTLELWVENPNPNATNSTVRSFSYGIDTPKGITVTGSIQPPYGENDYFNNLKMGVWNVLCNSANNIGLARDISPAETKLPGKRGILGIYTFKVDEASDVASINFNGEKETYIGSHLPDWAYIKPRTLQAAIIPENLATNIYLFPDTSDGNTPALNGKVPTPYISAKSFAGTPLVLERSSDLQNWTPVYTNNAGGSFSYTDSDAKCAPVSMYRVKTQ